MSTPKQNSTLEDSPLWQLARLIAAEARTAFRNVPYDEHYAFEVNSQQAAITLTSDIAMAVGKGKDAGFDFRYARGHLFTLKGLVLMGEERGFVPEPKKLRADIDKMQALLEKEIAAADADAEKGK